MPTTYSLRPIRSEDIEFLYELYASTRVDVHAMDWNAAQKEEFIRMQFDAQHKYYRQHYLSAQFDIILNGDGESIGRLYLDRRKDEICIVDITLAPNQRRRGIGGAVMNDILDEARLAKLPVRIYVEHYSRAVNWYSRLGFQKTGDTGVHFLMEWSPRVFVSTPGGITPTRNSTG